MIAILTDFGNDNIYTSIMKAVIKSINKKAEIIDITNSIPSQNIKNASFVLNLTYNYFPLNTTFLCVVDPGVGSERKSIVLKTEKYNFVAPDNGLLSHIIENNQIINAININNFKYLGNNISNTFHGRDIFAPISAFVDKKIELTELGNKINTEDLIRFNIKPYISENSIIGEIFEIDRFGNAVSNIHISNLQNKKIINIFFKSLHFSKIFKTYSDVDDGKPLAYIGSSGNLEFGIRNGDFAKHYGVNYFDKVNINIV